MKNDVVEKVNLTEIEESIANELGQADLVAEAVEKASPLLGEEGMKDYLLLVDFFASLDVSFSIWLLQSSEKILSAMETPYCREKTLKALLAMGRSKWSVVRQACRQLPLLSGAPEEFIPEWLGYGNVLAGVDQDVGLQYFEVGISVLEQLGVKQFPLWADLGQELAKKSWKAAKEYLKSSVEVLGKIDHGDLERWARLGIYLAEKSPRIKAGYDAHSLLAAGSQAGKSKKVELAVQYFKSAPLILTRLSIHDLEEWVEKGLETADALKDKGTSFFSLQSGSSRMAVEGLVKGLELKDVHTVLHSYAEALRGGKVRLRSSSLFYKNLPGLSRFFSVSDGTRLFLPSRIEVFNDEELNFKTFKWILTHELAHLVFGTFDLEETDAKRLDSLQKPVPAFRIFEFLEDERVDYLMGLQYPGLERDRRMIMDAYMAGKPSEKKGQRQSVLESLSFIGARASKESPVCDCTLMPALTEALSRVTSPGCTVAEVLDLTLGIYSSLGADAGCAVCERREAPDRLFYRGIIDFELVEAARSGMTRLVRNLADRFQEKGADVEKELVEAALGRIEDGQLLDSEELLWQIRDDERMSSLFAEVQQVIEDIEAEKRIRRSVYYDEWDSKLEDYRKDWCKVREMDMAGTSTVFYNRTIDENYGIVSLLRRHFSLLRPDRIRRYFREERGDDFDFDALIEAVVERHAGVTPSDRVYIRREKNLRDVSVAFLADMSYSTSDVLPSGKRIVDVEREGLVLMAEALESIGDSWAVYGFSTHYRDKVDFYVLRDFNETFDREAKSRFESIRPMAQTRLGAAIRHANSLLARQSSRIRLLILLSDGRPYDIDYGDADYAVEDTRRALWEGRKKGISSFCITVDKKSRDYLPYMYGEGKYTLIDNIETLPIRLPFIYKRLTT